MIFKRAKRIALVLASAAVALSIAACGSGASAESSSESYVPAAETESGIQVFLGSGKFAYSDDCADRLEPEQEQLLLNYMNLYYESLARLEVQDASRLFADPDSVQAQNSDIAWRFAVGVRGMQARDLSLTSYGFKLTCGSITRDDDGTVQVRISEDSVQNFASCPGVDSETFGAWHFFAMTDTDTGWKLAHHMDVIQWAVLGDKPAPQSGAFWQVSADGEQLEALLSTAESYTASRGSEAPVSDLTPDFQYDRQAAAEYADSWVSARNSQWPDYSLGGGNCQNYVSQCLIAGGIPMDIYGSAVWKWYGSAPDNLPGAYGRSGSWSAVSQFLDYAGSNSGYGLVARAGAPYYSGEIGDVLDMGQGESYHHTVIITGLITDEDGNTVDYLIDSNTSNQRSFPASAYYYTNQLLIRIYGWNN